MRLFCGAACGRLKERAGSVGCGQKLPLLEIGWKVEDEER
jgi:hypothetical protein